MSRCARLAVLLAWVAGGVDAVGFMTMYHLFVAHMSGNSAGLGVAIGSADWAEAFQRLFAIPTFLLGIAGGLVLNRVLERRGIGHRIAFALAIEAGLVAAFAVCGSLVSIDGSIPASPKWRFFLIAAFPLLAMGLQNATLQRAGGAGIHTTFVTGLLMSFIDAVVRCGFSLADGTVPATMWSSADARNVRLYGAMWLGYLCGAVLSAWICSHYLFAGLLPAQTGLIIAIVFDASHTSNPVEPE